MNYIERVIGNPATSEHMRRVADFLQLVTTNPIPIEIATRSLTGEKLFVWVNTVKPAKGAKYAVVVDDVEELLSIVAYVQSNGTLFPVGEYGLIAHCDLAFCRKQTGEQYVFTDLKCPPSQYVPPENLGWMINAQSVDWFTNSAMCLERMRPLVKGELDSYAVGIGELLHAIGVGMVLQKQIMVVKSLFFTKDGKNLWRKYGLIEDDAIVRQLDLVLATTAAINTICQHISRPN